jgi:hypothetical protein
MTNPETPRQKTTSVDDQDDDKAMLPKTLTKLRASMLLPPDRWMLSPSIPKVEMTKPTCLIFLSVDWERSG